MQGGVHPPHSPSAALQAIQRVPLRHLLLLLLLLLLLHHRSNEPNDRTRLSARRSNGNDDERHGAVWIAQRKRCVQSLLLRPRCSNDASGGASSAHNTNSQQLGSSWCSHCCGVQTAARARDAVFFTRACDSVHIILDV